MTVKDKNELEELQLSLKKSIESAKNLHLWSLASALEDLALDKKRFFMWARLTHITGIIDDVLYYHSTMLGEKSVKELRKAADYAIEVRQKIEELHVWPST